jgi:hypothetical protein
LNLSAIALQVWVTGALQLITSQSVSSGTKRAFESCYENLYYVANTSADCYLEITASRMVGGRRRENTAVTRHAQPSLAPLAQATREAGSRDRPSPGRRRSQSSSRTKHRSNTFTPSRYYPFTPIWSKWVWAVVGCCTCSCNGVSLGGSQSVARASRQRVLSWVDPGLCPVYPSLGLITGNLPVMEPRYWEVPSNDVILLGISQ